MPARLEVATVTLREARALSETAVEEGRSRGTDDSADFIFVGFDKRTLEFYFVRYRSNPKPKKLPAGHLIVERHVRVKRTAHSASILGVNDTIELVGDNI